jgi:DNA-binding ferritin-like protein
MHVNCSGPTFYQDHLLYERIYKDCLPFIDRLAERVAYLGEIALITVGAAHENSLLPQLPLDRPERFKEQLKTCTAHIHALIYSSIEAMNSLEDPVTQNMLCELGEQIDLFNYLLRG